MHEICKRTKRMKYIRRICRICGMCKNSAIYEKWARDVKYVSSQKNTVHDYSMLPIFCIARFTDMCEIFTM